MIHFEYGVGQENLSRSFPFLFLYDSVIANHAQVSSADKAGKMEVLVKGVVVYTDPADTMHLLPVFHVQHL